MPAVLRYNGYTLFFFSNQGQPLPSGVGAIPVCSSKPRGTIWGQTRRV